MIISLLITTIPNFLGKLLISRNKKDISRISESVFQITKETKDKNKIISFKKGDRKKMKKKFIIFYVFYVLIMSFDFYYVMIFCAVYQGSSMNWLADGFIGIIIFYIIKIFAFVFIVLMRMILRKYPNKFNRGLNWVLNMVA
jgi:hypothetical protein